MNPTDDTLDAESLASAATVDAGLDATVDATIDAASLEPGADPSLTVTREQPGRYVAPPERGVDELGRGGIGRVLVVRDAHLSREVALKELLRKPAPGSAGSSRDSVVLTRFLREARITGQLEHPNIVPVYELGQRRDGTLYYTMKVVRGRTMAEALAACKGLGDRLALLKHFADLCNAMAYAHARGIIHRDLKPGNVMLGAFGETVLLDWGLARPVDGAADAVEQALLDTADSTSDPAATTEGSILGTPLYMSPEQARGEPDLDPRTDVWSLGVMLYELLTGRRPFTGKSAVAVLSAVTGEDPPPITQVERDAPPELAAVAERALAKRRGDRYADAGQLAAEISAFLIGDRVRAYRYSFGDVVARFARRHKISLAVSTVAALLLLSLGVWAHLNLRDERDRAVVAEARATAAAEDARSAETRAMAARDEAEGLVQYMVGDLRQSLEPLGRLDLLDRVVARVVEHVDEAPEVGQPGGDPARMRSRAGIQFLIARLAAARGRSAEARAAAEEAHRLRTRLAEGDPTPQDQLELARSALQLAGLDRQDGDRASAQRHIAAARDRLRPLAEAGDAEARHSQASALVALGEMKATGGELEAAERLYRQALTLEQALVRAEPDEPRWTHALADVHDRLGDARFDQGDDDGALAAYTEALTLREALVAARPNNLQWVRAVGVSHDQLGDVHFKRGESQKALGAWREALDRLTRVYGANPSHMGWRRDAAIARLKMADGLAAMGKTQLAADSLAGVIGDLSALAGTSSRDTGWARDLNVARWRRADLLVELDQLGEARAMLDAALRDAEALVTRVPGNALYRHDRALAELKRGDLLARQGDAVDAAVAYRSAGRALGRLAQQDPLNAAVAGDRAVARRRLETVLARPDIDRVALWRAVKTSDAKELVASADTSGFGLGLAGVGQGGGGTGSGGFGSAGIGVGGGAGTGGFGSGAGRGGGGVPERGSAGSGVRDRDRSAGARKPAAAAPPAAAPPAAAPPVPAVMPADRDPLSLLDDPLLAGADTEAAPDDVRPWIGYGDREAPRAPVAPAGSDADPVVEKPRPTPRREQPSRPKIRMRPPAAGDKKPERDGPGGYESF